MKHLDINKNNFQQNLNHVKNGPWLTWYHADWCGHCRNMDSSWEELTNNNPGFNTLKLESAVINNTPSPIKDQEIQGFPTIVMYNNGKRVGLHDSGDRSTEALLNFAKKIMKLKKSKKSKKGKKQQGGRRSSRLIKKRVKKGGSRGLVSSMETGLERLDNLIGNIHNNRN
jgi:thioredoxin-like negative regulator of GroEL